jgi:hypothetical protein
VNSIGVSGKAYSGTIDSVLVTSIRDARRRPRVQTRAGFDEARSRAHSKGSQRCLMILEFPPASSGTGRPSTD